MNTLGFIKRSLLRSWNSLDTLDEQIYFITLFVTGIAAVVSAVFGLIQHLPLVSVGITFAIFIFAVILLLVSIHFPEQRNAQRLCLVLAINIGFFPTIFFASGGIHSGMSMFLLVGLFLSAIMLRGKLSVIVFSISLLLMELTITVADRMPQFVVEMTERQHYHDVKITLFQAGVSMYAITALVFKAYDRERKRNAELMDKLRKLSTRDELSGLYNSRELMRRLEVMFGKQTRQRADTLTLDGHYISMFGVDDFKPVREKYGHYFGDTVLASVSGVLDRAMDGREGEFAARYGGAEFVCILKAASMDEAYQKADTIREQVSGLQWNEAPKLRITISGGIVSCDPDRDVTQIFHDVDALLYQAKTTGKNRICRPAIE